MRFSTTTCCVFCLFVVFCPQYIVPSPQGEVVETWAKNFGNELWELANNMTQRTNITKKYELQNISVEKKNPKNLLYEIVENISKMLQRKMDAVRCILMAAEEAAEEYVFNETESNYTYYNSKYSIIINEENGNTFHPELPESLEVNSYMYDNISLNPDSHFHNIPVNTRHSSIHVPTNVYDRSVAAQSAIEWSETLDDIFVQNYNSDPALSWQYFGSSSGIMRHYPAMQWKQDVDQFDCRTRSWFIEAATCSKDIVILLDNSGSMTGYRNHIARFTVSKILDTFSNNDFINVFQYHNIVEPLEKCFNNTLVQATLENIAIFKSRMEELHPENNANLPVAMAKAFELLKQFREQRGCGEDSKGCNQAIMLVTDGVPNNVTEIFEQYNWLDNGTHIPVRVFPYLIGREVSHVPEVKWMACLNRGYFAHVQSLDETTEQVLKYIPVIARPLVLQGVEHPVSWTHAYITDNSFEDKNEGFENYRLLTSVAVPAYDNKMNQFNKSAELLGVAGTDVPIEDIEKLALPYKIGVNGYAFVVSNNGYLIMHPDLRPLCEGKLNKNYNSMDLSEVEFLDDDMEPRELNEKILELRESLVNHSEGSLFGLPMKNFHDDMRRGFRELYDYYFAPLKDTPFSFGIALPQSHGLNLLKSKDSIGYNQHLGIDSTSYFKTGNWKIHPKWVYCKYHYLEGHEFKTPEEELLHFLQKTSEKDWKWFKQYEEQWEDEFDTPENEDEAQCGRKTLEDDDFYCDKDLLQQLVFDAMVTYEAFFNTMQFESDQAEELLKYYNASLRFVATMSGLTRWQYMFGQENQTGFGDSNSKSIEETWYKSAVLQHSVDLDSFVYSVPFDSGSTKQNITVTGSHAIFPRDAGLEAPGSVVGFQFQHSQLHKRFMNITSHVACDGCIQPCHDEMLDCYVIDSNGYIILSEIHNDTGRFFGEIEGAIMESMVQNNTFHTMTVYDLQAVCTILDDSSSASNILLTPFYYVSYLLHWTIQKTAWMILETNFYSLWNGNWAAAFENYDDSSLPLSTTERPVETPKPTRKLRKGQNREEEEYFKALEEKEPEEIFISYPCDKKATLYILNQTKFIHGEGFSGAVRSDCSRPYFAKRIPFSNLILIVINTTTQTCDKKLMASKQDIIYPSNNQPPCNKLQLNNLPRRKLSGCFNEHPMEHTLTVCRSSTIQINVLLFILECIFLKLYYN